MAEWTTLDELDDVIDRVVFGNPPIDHGTLSCPDVPPYSTEMSAAWLVVDRLREIGFSIIIGDEDDEWEIEVITTRELYDRGYRGVYVQDASPARAICRAALYVFEQATH